MPRFVVLRHETSQGTHFDLMLEAGDVLKTWSLPTAPQSGVVMECETLPDHRLAYLDYEGPVSGGRGSVVRWDSGTCRLQQQDDTQWTAELAGEKLSGTAILRRMANEPARWQFTFSATDVSD